MLDGVLQGQDASLALGLLAHIGLLMHAPHHALVPGVPHDGREDSPGGIVACKAGLAHARAVVNDEHGGIIIHGELISNRRAFKRLSFLFFTLSIPSKYFFSLSWL